MSIAQTLIENFSNKSKTYKDNFFFLSHSHRNWEIGLAYTFDRAAQTLDGVVHYLQHPTLDFAAITTFALKDVRDAKRAQELLEKSTIFDEYLDEPREYVEGWPSDVPELSFAEKIKTVQRAKQDAEADLKIIGLRAFQRATRKYHEWGERLHLSGIGRETTYRSDVYVADVVVGNQVDKIHENKKEVLGLAGFVLVTIGTPLAFLAHHYLSDVPENYGDTQSSPPVFGPPAP